MQQKQETFIKFGNLTEGKIFGRLRIPILGKKGNMEIQKIARKRKADFWTKNPSTRTALKGCDRLSKTTTFESEPGKMNTRSYLAYINLVVNTAALLYSRHCLEFGYQVIKLCFYVSSV